MTSDYAQTFSKSDDKPRESSFRRGHVKVRSLTVKPETETHSGGAVRESVATGRNRGPVGNRQLLLCFVCNDSTSRHYLGHCNKFKALTNESKSRAVIKAQRCFNCLATGHIALNCPKDMKCRVCGPGRVPRTAFVDQVCDNCGPRLWTNTRTSAVRVFNPNTGMSALAFAQHDIASQATLISEGLKDELGLDVDSSQKVEIRSVAEQNTSCAGVTNFNMQSLTTNKTYVIQDALVVPDFVEEENVLLHSINVSKLNHFKGIKLPTIPSRKNIDILIGQTDKSLLTVLEEREGSNSDDPTLVFTRLGPIASGGRM